MEHKIFFSLFTILLLFLFSDGYNALLSKNKNEKAILLALLKKAFVDNNELQTRNDLKNEIQNIRKMQLNPSDYNKFERFLESFFKYYEINAKIKDEEKRILHSSGVFNEFYVDIDSTDEETLRSHFNDIKEKALNLIRFIFHSNLIFPHYDLISYDQTHEHENKIAHQNERLEYIGEVFKHLLHLKNNLKDKSNGDFIINFYSNYVNVANPYQVNPLPKTEEINEYKKFYVEGDIKKDVEEGIQSQELEKEEDNFYKGEDEVDAESIIQELTERVEKEYPSYNPYEQEAENELPEEDEQVPNYEPRKNRDKDLSQQVNNSDDSDYKDLPKTEQESSNQVPSTALDDFLSNPYMYRYNNRQRKNPTNQNVYLKNNNSNKYKHEPALQGKTFFKRINFTEKIAKNKKLKSLLTLILKLLRQILNIDGKNDSYIDLKRNITEKDDTVIRLKNNKNLPIHKKNEMRINKIKNKDDNEDKTNAKKNKNTMFVNIGQNGASGFLNFFDFRENSLKENIRDLLNITEELKLFNILETAIFIQKFTENICASYCMEITDVVEIANFDLFLFKKMNFVYTNDSMTIKTANEHVLNLKQFEKILNLLNINGETIALNCPCKYYSDRIISYCKQQRTNMKSYFTDLKMSKYVKNFSPSYALKQLKTFQDKLMQMKNYGKIIAADPRLEYAGKKYYDSASYHNHLYFPPLDKVPHRLGTLEDFKFPDIDTMNFYYNGSLVNINEMPDITKIVNEEIKSKVLYINSYRIGNQFFPTYSSLGKDDHEIHLSGAPTTNKLTGLNNLYRKLRSFNYGNLKSTYSYKKGKSNNVSLLHEIQDKKDWMPLKKPLNHEDFYNRKKLYTDMFDIKEPKIDENKLKAYINTKYDFLNEEKEENTEHIQTNNVNDNIINGEESVNLQNAPILANNNVSKRTINASYLIFFFKNLHVWKVYTYCFNIDYIKKILANINFNEDIIFEEDYKTDSVSFYFSNDTQTKHKINMEYFVFLLEKVSLLMYIEDLCEFYEYGKNNSSKKMDKYLENKENALSFLERRIMDISEVYDETKKYSEELSGISSSNLFGMKNDITLNSSSYNNITLEEKELHQIFYVYVEELLEQKLSDGTWFIPYGLIIYSQNKSEYTGSNLKIIQNNYLTKFTRNAIEKYIFYEYRRITTAIHSVHDKLKDKVYEHTPDLKVFRLIIYNDNPSMANIIIKTTVNVFNIAFLQSILEVLLDIRGEQQFFSYEGRYIPANAFIVLDKEINYLFFNYIPNEDHIQDKISYL